MTSNNDQIEARLLDAKTNLHEVLAKTEMAFEDAEEELHEHDDVRDSDVEFRGTLREIRSCLQNLAMQALDTKRAISYISTGGLMESDEFHQNIKPGHDDAFYGAQAANREMGREVMWPLKLNEWEKERATQTSPRGDYDLVSASGTTKYTKRLGSGATVTLVIDERGMGP